MKRVKIMLTAIGVLAIVGGSFALKAKKYGFAYCTSIVKNGVCTPNGTVGKRQTATTRYYTPTNNLANCALVTCPLTGIIVDEQ